MLLQTLENSINCIELLLIMTDTPTTASLQLLHYKTEDIKWILLVAQRLKAKLLEMLSYSNMSWAIPFKKWIRIKKVFQHFVSTCNSSILFQFFLRYKQFLTCCKLHFMRFCFVQYIYFFTHLLVGKRSNRSSIMILTI